VSIGVNWAEVWAPVWKAVWTDVAPVEVPDVVGELEADGTTTLETALFVVSVSTEYSASVAAGLIISQDPVGGSFAASGSTVAIVVSLGPEPVAEQSQGGSAKRKPKKRFLYEIDGQFFEADSNEEAREQVIAHYQQKSHEKAVDEAVPHVEKRIRRGKGAKVKAPALRALTPEAEPFVSEFQPHIDAMFARIARDAEIRVRMQLEAQRKLDEDDEEAIAVLLLH
jgi:hypothetical protein